MENLVYKRLLKDDASENFGLMVFPSWQDCRDFKWTWDVKNPSEKLQAIQSAIAAKCSSGLN
jgi:hypothetical protein